MKAKFKPKQELDHRGVKKTVRTSKVDHSAKTVQYKFEGSNEYVDETELKEWKTQQKEVPKKPSWKQSREKKEADKEIDKSE